MQSFESLTAIFIIFIIELTVGIKDKVNLSDYFMHSKLYRLFIFKAIVIVFSVFTAHSFATHKEKPSCLLKCIYLFFGYPEETLLENIEYNQEQLRRTPPRQTIKNRSSKHEEMAISGKLTPSQEEKNKRRALKYSNKICTGCDKCDGHPSKRIGKKNSKQPERINWQ